MALRNWNKVLDIQPQIAYTEPYKAGDKLMKKGEMLGRMIVFAVNKHEGQLDKAGVPYFLHPLHVMLDDTDGPDDEELQCIKVGHDLFEDTDATIEELLEIGMTERVIKGISALTKMPGESYEVYKAKVLSNPDARRAKKADIRHNSDLTRLPQITEKALKRHMRYAQFYAEIEERDAIESRPTGRSAVS